MYVRQICVCVCFVWVHVYGCVFEYGSALSNPLRATAKAFIEEPSGPVSPLSGFQCHYATPRHPLPSWWPRKRWDSRGEPSGLVRRLEESLIVWRRPEQKIYHSCCEKRQSFDWCFSDSLMDFKVLKSFTVHVEFNELSPLKPMKDLLHHFRRIKHQWCHFSFLKSVFWFQTTFVIVNDCVHTFSY